MPQNRARLTWKDESTGFSTAELPGLFVMVVAWETQPGARWSFSRPGRAGKNETGTADTFEEAKIAAEEAAFTLIPTIIAEGEERVKAQLAEISELRATIAP